MLAFFQNRNSLNPDKNLKRLQDIMVLPEIDNTANKQAKLISDEDKAAMLKRLRQRTGQNLKLLQSN